MPYYDISKLSESYFCPIISATGMMADSPGGDRIIIQCFMNLVKSLFFPFGLFLCPSHPLCSNPQRCIEEMKL